MNMPKKLIVAVLALGTVGVQASWMITVPDSATLTPEPVRLAPVLYVSPEAEGTLNPANFNGIGQTNPAMLFYGPPFHGIDQSATALIVPFSVPADWKLSSLALDTSSLLGVETLAGNIDQEVPPNLTIVQPPEPAQTLAGALILGFSGVVASGRRLFNPPPA